MALALITAGCGGPQFAPGGQPDPTTTLPALPPQPLDQVLILEQEGISPTDTVVRFDAASGRRVLLRHAPPDNAVFAVVDLPPDSSASDSITLTLRPTPGRYGLAVSAVPRLPSGGSITFSYAIHFRAPSLDSSRYRGDVGYAQWLGVGRLTDPDRLTFLPYRRPAADMLRAPMAEPGEYLVAAPR